MRFRGMTLGEKIVCIVGFLVLCFGIGYATPIFVRDIANEIQDKNTLETLTKTVPQLSDTATDTDCAYLQLQLYTEADIAKLDEESRSDFAAFDDGLDFIESTSSSIASAVESLEIVREDSDETNTFQDVIPVKSEATREIVIVQFTDAWSVTKGETFSLLDEYGRVVGTATALNHR